jgi:putative tricarboxylic transport membrane protein
VETLLTLLLPLFAIGYIWGATQVTEPPRNIVVGPRTFPLLIGWTTLAVSIALVWQRMRAFAKARRAAAADTPTMMVPLEDDEASVSDWPAVWWTLGFLLALFVLLERLGFAIAITLFLFGLSTLFAPRRWALHLVIALAFSLAFYYVFTQVLGIPLPNGLLEPFF